MTSKCDSLTRNLMHITYKGETYITNTILREFRQISDIGLRFFFWLCMGYCVLAYCFVTTFETQNNDLSYHDQTTDYTSMWWKNSENISSDCSGIRGQTSCCVSFCVQYILLRIEEMIWYYLFLIFWADFIKLNSAKLDNRLCRERCSRCWTVIIFPTNT